MGNSKSKRIKIKTEMIPEQTNNSRSHSLASNTTGASEASSAQTPQSDNASNLSTEGLNGITTSDGNASSNTSNWYPAGSEPQQQVLNR